MVRSADAVSGPSTPVRGRLAIAGGVTDQRRLLMQFE
jgi:hypothetical protein